MPTQLPPFRPVQLAQLVDTVPTGNGWLHEMKYDGYRCLLSIGGRQAKAYTRSGLDWSDKFAPVVASASRLPVRSALIDGEIVVLDEKGRSRFQILQSSLKGGTGDLTFFAFDLLELNGMDLTRLPLIERKTKLAKILARPPPRIHLSDHIEGSGEKLLREFCSAGLEGIISKRADAAYSGSRSGSWLKIKCIQRQEFVVVGWTPSDKKRGFRSLLIAVNENGRLRYAGKVGTGFDDREIEALLKRMRPLEQSQSTVSAPRPDAKGAHWLKPGLVAEIAFTEMTGEGVLRHPSYLGLREDKRPEAVTPEKRRPVAKALKSTVTISNPDRVIFPGEGITKGQLAAYYEAIAEAMLPWVAERPISLIRCPQGRAKKCFFQKHDAGSFGENVKHIAIREKDGSSQPYLFVENTDGLLACVQMGTIEFHGWGARIEDVEKADRLVFDLDPDEGLDFKSVVSAALHVRDLLAQIKLEIFPMVTGGKGVHLVAPLTPKAEWPKIKQFSRRFAEVLAENEPDRFTANLSKASRKGRIFIDYLRNQRGATAVMPYVARAREGAPVAVPLTWRELVKLDRPSHWHIGDIRELMRRARSQRLSNWGRADQTLPDIT